MESEEPALHSQGAILGQKFTPLFNVEGHAQAEASMVHGETVVIFDHRPLPDKAIEKLGHGGRIKTRSFTIGQSVQQKTAFVVHSNGTMAVLGHLKSNGRKGAFVRKEHGLILLDTRKHLGYRCFAFLSAVAMRVNSKVLIFTCFVWVLLSNFLQRIIKQYFFESRDNIAQGRHDAAFVRAAIQTEPYPKQRWNQKEFVDRRKFRSQTSDNMDR